MTMLRTHAYISHETTTRRNPPTRICTGDRNILTDPERNNNYLCFYENIRATNFS